jgi:hypothetical protein
MTGSPPCPSSIWQWPRSAPAYPATPASPPASYNAASWTPGQIITTPDTITVRLGRRAYAPVLRKAAPDTRPLVRNRTLRYELA